MRKWASLPASRRRPGYLSLTECDVSGFSLPKKSSRISTTFLIHAELPRRHGLFQCQRLVTLRNRRTRCTPKSDFKFVAPNRPRGAGRKNHRRGMAPTPSLSACESRAPVIHFGDKLQANPGHNKDKIPLQKKLEELVLLVKGTSKSFGVRTRACPFKRLTTTINRLPMSERSTGIILSISPPRP